MSEDSGLTRLRQAFYATRPTDVPGRACPSAERIWGGVHDELGPAELRQVLRHVAGCPVCTEAWRLAEELGKGNEEKKTGRLSVAEQRARLRWAGVAAAAILAVALGPLLFDGGERRPADRADKPAEIELLSESSLPRGDFLLRWKGPAEAGYFSLTVTWTADPMKALVEEPEIEASEHRVAPEVLADLPSGAELSVHLAAYDPIEGELDAATFSIELR